MQEYIIIGGGVIGTFIAHELSQTTSSITLIEKEEDLALVQTKNNSALIHSPVMVPPHKGELKAKLALEGNQIYQSLVDEFKVPHLKNGAYVLALNEEEMRDVKALYEDAKARNLDASIVSVNTLRRNEKNVSKKVVGGLELKDAMTADTFALCQILEKSAKSTGVRFEKSTTVTDITVLDDGFLVTTNHNKSYKTKHVINAAGVKAEHIAKMVEAQPPYKMMPHRGEYMVLPSTYRNFVNHTFFPVPKKDTKGILAIPQPNGTIRLGPTSTFQEALDEAKVTQEGLTAIKTTMNQLLNYVPYSQVEKTYAGIRSTINQDDFYIKRSFEHPNFIHVAGIDSPGVTAAPAIAKYLKKEILNLK